MYCGDFATGSTVVGKFNTTSFSDGSPITLAGTPSLAVYKAGSATESTAGVTLNVDYDSKTGLHNFSIDTSADGTFYSTNTQFQVFIAAGTVGGTSVVARVVGNFTLGNQLAKGVASVTGNVGGSVNSVTTGVTVTTNNDKTGYALSSPQTFNLTGSITGNLSGTVGSVTGNVGGNVVGTVASVVGNVGGNVTGTVASIVSPGNVWDVVLASHLTAGSTGFALNAAGSAGDPWGTALPGAYGAGTAGHIVGTALPDIAPGATNGLLKAGSNAATTFATLTSTGVFTINGVSNVSQTGDSFARIGSTGSALTSLAPSATALSTAQWSNARAGYLDNINNANLASVPTFPANFSVLSISGAGAVTAGTVSDKTGYSLAATQTFNNTGTWTGNLSGSVGSVSGNVGGNVAGSVASVVAGVSLATGALTDTAIATSGANRIADTNRRRQQSNVEVSSYGDALSLSSEYGLIQQVQESSTVPSPESLTVYRTDGTTVLGTRTLTTSPSAEPVTSVS